MDQTKTHEMNMIEEKSHEFSLLLKRTLQLSLELSVAKRQAITIVDDDFDLFDENDCITTKETHKTTGECFQDRLLSEPCFFSPLIHTTLLTDKEEITQEINQRATLPSTKVSLNAEDENEKQDQQQKQLTCQICKQAVVDDTVMLLGCDKCGEWLHSTCLQLKECFVHENCVYSQFKHTGNLEEWRLECILCCGKETPLLQRMNEPSCPSTARSKVQYLLSRNIVKVREIFQFQHEHARSSDIISCTRIGENWKVPEETQAKYSLLGCIGRRSKEQSFVVAYRNFVIPQTLLDDGGEKGSILNFFIDPRDASDVCKKLKALLG